MPTGGGGSLMGAGSGLVKDNGLGTEVGGVKMSVAIGLVKHFLGTDRMKFPKAQHPISLRETSP